MNSIIKLFNNDKLIVNSFYVLMIIYYAYRLFEITVVELMVNVSIFHILYASGVLIFLFILANRIIYNHTTETGEGFALYEYRLVNIMVFYELILILFLILQTALNINNFMFVEHIIHKIVINLLALNFLVSRSSDLRKILELAKRLTKVSLD